MALGPKTLRLQLRFLLPLLITLTIAASLAVPLLDRMTLRWFIRDLNARGMLVSNALSDSVAQALADRKPVRLAPLFERAVADGRLFAVALCASDNTLVQASARYPRSIGWACRLLRWADASAGAG